MIEQSTNGLPPDGELWSEHFLGYDAVIVIAAVMALFATFLTVANIRSNEKPQPVGTDLQEQIPQGSGFRIIGAEGSREVLYSTSSEHCSAPYDASSDHAVLEAGRCVPKVLLPHQRLELLAGLPHDAEIIGEPEVWLGHSSRGITGSVTYKVSGGSCSAAFETFAEHLRITPDRAPTCRYDGTGYGEQRA